jgi:hypothetical protein
MGITIVYTFIVDSKEKLDKVMEVAKYLANKFGYHYDNWEDEGVVFLDWTTLPKSVCESEEEFNECIEAGKRWLKEKYGNFIQVNEKITIHELNKPQGVICFTKEYDDNGNFVEHFHYSYIRFISKRYIDNYDLKPEECYPTVKKGIIINTGTTDSFIIAFFEFKGYYICYESCKTQPFVEEEVMPNIKHHINFITILEAIKEIADHTYILDEGEYYETHNSEKLLQNFKEIKEMIWNISKPKNCVVIIGGKYKLQCDLDEKS